MFDYLRDTSWAVDHVRFEYLGGIYRGRGRLSWNPNRGFHLDAFLDRQGLELPSTIEFGKIRGPDPSELRSVRMRLEGGGRAITPQLALGDQLELTAHSRLDIDFPSFLFTRAFPVSAHREKYFGSAVFDVGKGLVFPDRVDRDVRVNDQLIKQNLSSGGISHEDDSLKVRAWLEPEGQMHMEWSLSANAWSRTDAWTYAEGAEAALSFLAGRTVRLLERTTRRGGREYRQRIKRRPCVKLGILSLPPRQHRSPDQIDKEQFIRLARFFTLGGQEAHVARHICAQMAEATRQETRAAQELLCSTILEAALRTIDGHPFSAGDKTWNIRTSMQRFRIEHLSDAWTSACDAALDVRKRLRHRNAHPDWLTTEGGGLSDAGEGKRLDDMIRLAWFYGYMILALAKFRNLEPKFPASYKTWKPILTVTRSSGQRKGKRPKRRTDSPIQRARRIYPRAYKRWTEKEDDQLRTCFAAGKTTRELSALLKRQPGSICSRVKKLGLRLTRRTGGSTNSSTRSTA